MKLAACTSFAFSTLAALVLGMLVSCQLYPNGYTAHRIGPIPACQYEDGNPDGKPCFWTDPDTGDEYYQDGSNYR